ncbi:uncharacterized protein LOC127706604 [Mytilus californianus]|uniref:uncharacterized protein LOC127706604 n=1 Tax=Mytilus californianus TaxID=6549 RepID=UPI0022462B20|nr:uncharacterized protein LOC127706604 [Mytilus californianus]
MSDIGDDLDFQSDMSTVSVQYTGFESHLHGVMAYEWAVGTTQGGKKVQPFMPHGVIHNEEKDVKGDGKIRCNTVLLYTPCKDCYGVESIPIILQENQSDPDIPPADTPVTVTINVIDVNNPPVMFVTQFGWSVMHSDPTEPILIYLEQMNTFNKENWSEQFTALIGAYDIDRSDSLHIEVNEPSHGNHTLTEKSTLPFDVQPCTESPQVNSLPCGNFSHTLPYAGKNMSWIYYSLSYDQAMLFSGYDELKIYINDTHNATSNVVTMRFIIMESLCNNEGICEGNDIYR